MYKVHCIEMSHPSPRSRACWIPESSSDWMVQGGDTRRIVACHTSNDAHSTEPKRGFHTRASGGNYGVFFSTALNWCLDGDIDLSTGSPAAFLSVFSTRISRYKWSAPCIAIWA